MSVVVLNVPPLTKVFVSILDKSTVTSARPPFLSNSNVVELSVAPVTKVSVPPPPAFHVAFPVEVSFVKTCSFVALLTCDSEFIAFCAVPCPVPPFTIDKSVPDQSPLFIANVPPKVNPPLVVIEPVKVNPLTAPAPSTRVTVPSILDKSAVTAESPPFLPISKVVEFNVAPVTYLSLSIVDKSVVSAESPPVLFSSNISPLRVVPLMNPT